jgi:hypothetical protein
MTLLGCELGNLVATVSPCEINDTPAAPLGKIAVSVELPAVLKRPTTWGETEVSWFLAANGDALNMLPLDSVMASGSAPGGQQAQSDPLQDGVSCN